MNNSYNILRIITLTVVLFVATISVWAQKNIYVLNDTTPQTVSILPGVTSISCWDEKATIYYGKQIKEINVKKVKRMSITEPKSHLISNVPQSYLDDIDFDIFFDSNDNIYAGKTETEVTDEQNKKYEDFVEHCEWLHRIEITYVDNTAKVSGDVDGVNVVVNGNHVVVHSDTSKVEYVLRGNSNNGSFKIYGSDRFKVVLDGLQLTNPQGPALNSQCKKRMFLVLNEGTENSLTDGSNYKKVSGEDQRGCLFSEGQVCISGSGSLTIDGNKKNGLASDQYVHILSGFLKITTHADKGNGVKVQSKFMMGGGAMQILTEGSAAKGISSDSLIEISGGKITAICTGDVAWDSDEQDYSSSCCLKASRDLIINNAEVWALATGTGGKGISAGEQVKSTIELSDGNGGTISKYLLQKSGSSYVNQISRKIGDLNISNSKIWVKTAGMRPENKLTFNIADSPYFYYESSGFSPTTMITMNVSASPKAIKAANNVNISNSEIYVRCLGGNGGEGIEAKSKIVMNNTKVRNVTFDDGINASSSSIDEGCDILVISVDNDGIDSKLEKCGGIVYSIGGSGDQRGIDTDASSFNVPSGTRLITFGGNDGHNPKKGQNSIMANFYSNPAYIALIDSVENKCLMCAKTPSGYSSCLTMLLSIPEIELGKSYKLVSFSDLISGDEDHGFINNAKFETEKVEYSFTTSVAATVLNKENTSGGGSNNDDFEVTLGTIPYRIVNATTNCGSIVVNATNTIAYEAADSNLGDESWWYLDTNSNGAYRLRNVSTELCITCPSKEYSIVTTTASNQTGANSWWICGSKDGFYQFYIAKGTTTKWYMKISNNSEIKADRYQGTSTFYLIDSNGNKVLPQ